jgi:hypothetical protein
MTIEQVPLAEQIAILMKLTLRPRMALSPSRDFIQEEWDEREDAALKTAVATLQQRERLTADLAAANERIARLEGAMQPMIEALEFYADPETYFGLAVIADPPCGGFAEDFSDDHGHPSLDGNRYGKTARKAFELADAALSPVET